MSDTTEKPQDIANNNVEAKAFSDELIADISKKTEQTDKPAEQTADKSAEPQAEKPSVPATEQPKSEETAQPPAEKKPEPPSEVKADKADDKPAVVADDKKSAELTEKKSEEKTDDKPTDDKKSDNEKSDDKKAEDKQADKATVDNKKSNELPIDDKKSDKTSDDTANKKTEKTKQPIRDERLSSAKVGFGKALAKARREKGMSVDDVAKKLNRLKRQIEAIEAEDYDNLPQFAFAKGFAGSYARLVGLDDYEIGQQFELGYPSYLKKEETAEEIYSPLRPMGTLKRDRLPIRINAGLIAGIVAVLILGVAMLKMIGNATKTNDDVAVQNAQVVDSLTLTEQAQGAAIGDNPVAVGVAAGNNANPATANASVGVLDFWLKENTTIKVVDSTNTTLMTGEQKKGGYQLTGKPPFKIEITNPARVDLNFNKTPVKLSEHIKGNKANFTLQ